MAYLEKDPAEKMVEPTVIEMIHGAGKEDPAVAVLKKHHDIHFKKSDFGRM